MKSRIDIKLRGKQLFLANYWPCVLVCLLFWAISVALNINSIKIDLPFFNAKYHSNIFSPAVFLLNILSIFILPVLNVGMASFFSRLDNGESPAITDMFTCAFSRDYIRKLGGMVWMSLLTILWTLLFIVPGIYMGMAYSLTPYILAEYPNVSAEKAIEISRRVTRGHVGDIFMFGLSYLGWLILSGLTAGILGVLFTTPYMSMSFAGMYHELMRIAIDREVITEEQLGVNK